MLDKFEKVDYIYNVFFKYFPNIDPQDLFKRTRKRFIVERRQILFCLCYELTECSYSDIGKYFCPSKPFNHSTVMHACKVTHNLIETDKYFNNVIISLKKECKESIKPKKDKELLSFRMDVLGALRRSKTKEVAVNELMMLL